MGELDFNIDSGLRLRSPSTFSFFDNVYHPKPVTIEKPDLFAKNVEAIVNPTQVLKDEQLAQVAQTIANIKLEGLKPDLVSGVLTAKDDYEKWYMNALRYNEDGTPKKGLSRLRLTDAQKIEAKTKQDALMRSVGYVDYIGGQLPKAEMKALQEGITGDEYNAWYSDFTKKVKEAKTPSDYPDPLADLSVYLAKKPLSENDMNKYERDYFATNIISETFPVDMGGGKYMNVTQFNPAIVGFQAQDLMNRVSKAKEYAVAKYGSEQGYIDARVQEYQAQNKRMQGNFSLNFSPNSPGAMNLEGEPLRSNDGYRIGIGDQAQTVSGRGYVVKDDDTTDKNDEVVIKSTQASTLITDLNQEPLFWEVSYTRPIPKTLSDGSDNPKYRDAYKQSMATGNKELMNETIMVRIPVSADAKELLKNKKVFLKKNIKGYVKQTK